MAGTRTIYADDRYSGDFEPDNRGIGGCQHPQGMRYVYEDLFDGERELWCRQCGRMIGVFQPPEPEPEETGHTVGAQSCLNCCRVRKEQGGPAGTIRCSRCNTPLLVVDDEGNQQLPEFSPPPWLECTCCQRLLPPFCFIVKAAAVKRGGRAYQCRGCTAFRNRVNRQENGDRIRAIGRKHEQRKASERKEAGIKRPALTEAQRTAANAAAARYYARQQGRAVPKQRQGGTPILLKPVCRIADSCPLRDYCTTESKGLA